jgi:hypothetical protein
MADGGIAFNDTQLQAILATLKSLKSEGVHWEQVISIFLSAFSATVVGMLIEIFKRKTTKERLKREVEQINTVLVGIGYNIETLLHAAFQSIIPHHKQSHEAYAALHAAGKDDEKLRQVFLSLSEYRALMMTCPEQFLIEIDFLDKMTFIIEKDPEFVKKTGWIISLSRLLNNAVRDRNKYIEIARTSTTIQGELTVYQLDNILHILASIADSECITTFQLFEELLSTARSLEALNATYEIPGKKSKLVPPEALKEAMTQLRQIAQPFIDDMYKTTQVI